MTQQEYENQLNAAYGNNDYQTVHKLGQAMLREGMPIGSYYMASASTDTSYVGIYASWIICEVFQDSGAILQ